MKGHNLPQEWKSLSQISLRLDSSASWLSMIMRRKVLAQNVAIGGSWTQYSASYLLPFRLRIGWPRSAPVTSCGAWEPLNTFGLGVFFLFLPFFTLSLLPNSFPIFSKGGLFKFVLKTGVCFNTFLVNLKVPSIRVSRADNFFRSKTWGTDIWGGRG